MWLIEYLTSGLSTPFPVLSIALFRVCFSCAIIIKLSVDTRRGHYRHFEPNSYLFSRYYAIHRKVLLTPQVYRLVYLGKWVAAFLLLCGVAANYAAAFLAIAFWIESRIFFKFHVCLFCLVSALLAINPGMASAFTYSTLIDWFSNESALRDIIITEGARTSDPFSQVLIVLTIWIMYWASVRRKLSSPEFFRGLIMWDTLVFLDAERDRRKFPDGWYTPWFKRAMVYLPEQVALRRWGPFMLTTICIQASLPLLLISGPLFPLGVFLGAAMHFAITCAYPITLLHFSLATISTYLLFADPRWILLVLS